MGQVARAEGRRVIIKTPISRVSYAIESHPTIPGVEITRVMRTNGALHSHFVDAAAMRWLAAELLARADEQEARAK